MIKILKEEAAGITRRILKRDFSGYTGLAVKNSIYQFGTTIISQIGTLIFTIIIARMLMPELFGLYSLVLSTLSIFLVFSNLGISSAVVRFISSKLGKRNKKKAKSYFWYLFKIKFLLSIIAVVLLVSLAKIISENYYNKPLLGALIIGAAYLFFSSMNGFLSSLFRAKNDLKPLLTGEVLFQLSRLAVVGGGLFIILKMNLSVGANLAWTLLFVAIAHAIIVAYIHCVSRKRIGFLKSKTLDLKPSEKKEVMKYLLPLSTLVLSGVFFSNIDTIMLGRFVQSDFIAFYRTAFSLLGASLPLVSFSIVLFPIFSRLSGKRLEIGLKKSLLVTFLLSLATLIAILILAPYLVYFIFGPEYMPAVQVLRVLSLILLISPFIDIYSSYLNSSGKTKITAKLLISGTILNIVLNYFFITWFLNLGQIYAVFGAAAATILSKMVLLGGLVIVHRKIKKT